MNKCKAVVIVFDNEGNIVTTNKIEPTNEVLRRINDEWYKESIFEFHVTVKESKDECTDNAH